jgi:hypothetical protein
MQFTTCIISQSLESIDSTKSHTLSIFHRCHVFHHAHYRSFQPPIISSTTEETSVIICQIHVIYHTWNRPVNWFHVSHRTHINVWPWSYPVNRISKGTIKSPKGLSSHWDLYTKSQTFSIMLIPIMKWTVESYLLWLIFFLKPRKTQLIYIISLISILVMLVNEDTL